MATRKTSDRPAEQSLQLRFDAFELDEADARLTRDGEPIPLAPRPFAVLCALARTPQTLVTKNALLDSVWGHRFVSDSVLKTTMSALRAALGDDPKQPRYIETVSRRGYRFIGALDARATPGGTAPAAMSSMIGRAEALERLRAAWQLAGSGKRQIVWIAGEPGVGKTTLIEHFMAEVGEVHCAHGQCVEQSGAGEPYLPVLEALRALCRRDPSSASSFVQSRPPGCCSFRGCARRGTRGVAARALRLGPGSNVARVGGAVGALRGKSAVAARDRGPALERPRDGAAHRPRCAPARAARLLWLASFRLTEIMAADHPLKSLRHELRLHGLSEEIVLDAFSEQEVARVRRRERSRPCAGREAFVRALHARTDGLPLFVADVVSDLIAGRGSRSGSLAMPTGLAGIIEQYMQRLTPAERALLEAASVCGIEFRLATVARVLQGDVAALGASCVELVRRQRWLTDAGGGYAFRHALYREVLYNQIGPLARAELHRKVAAALERERADGAEVSAAELASHLELAHQYIPAVRYYAEAAESALLQFSPSETIELAERALALLRGGASDERAHPGDHPRHAAGRGRHTGAWHRLDPSEAAFERAQSLLDDAPRHPLRGLVLHPLGFSLYEGRTGRGGGACSTQRKLCRQRPEIGRHCFARVSRMDWFSTCAAGRASRATGSRKLSM